MPDKLRAPRSSSRRQVLIFEFLLPEDSSMAELGKHAAATNTEIASKQSTIDTGISQIAMVDTELAEMQ